MDNHDDMINGCSEMALTTTEVKEEYDPVTKWFLPGYHGFWPFLRALDTCVSWFPFQKILIDKAGEKQEAGPVQVAFGNL